MTRELRSAVLDALGSIGPPGTIQRWVDWECDALVAHVTGWVTSHFRSSHVRAQGFAPTAAEIASALDEVLADLGVARAVKMEPRWSPYPAPIDS